LNAGNGQWGKAMQQDITDATKWLIDNKIAQKDKIAIYGASYGGYAVLTGLTRTPDLYACGVEGVGPSNLVTLIRGFPKVWRSFYSSTVRRIGSGTNFHVGIKEFSKL